ncbi:MAG: hypothetical protein B6I24_07905 [Bacteroidetes bacterium 4572_128]|nr:MAG: hypothetical protein B6I24_07905 [Bacteroidetes bacterium 4572_128]
MSKIFVENLPIPEITNLDFEKKIDLFVGKIIFLNENLEKEKNNFLLNLSEEFDNLKFTRKIIPIK